MSERTRGRGTPPRGLRAARAVDASGPLVVFGFDVPNDELARLSAIEREVVDLLVLGLTRDQIAIARGRSPKTVGKQIQSAYRKLGVSSRGELAAKMGTRVR